MDKLTRRYIWGGGERTHKFHLVPWQSVAAPRDRGGLGLRRMKDTNIAFMLKLEWGIYKGSNALWAKVLRGKYGVTHTSSPWRISASASPLWRAISKSWPLLQEGIVWEMGDGRSIHFWTDKWLFPDFLL